VIHLEINDLMEECWICRRTKDELEKLGIELFQIEGTNYDSHTVCRACEDIIYELTSEIDDEILEEKIRTIIKYLLQDMIDSDALTD
jgi:hypothetical protein